MTVILFLAANPLNTSPLRLDEEVRAIDVALRQIVHFSGHGSETSEIILQDDDGDSVAVPAVALSSLFRVLKANVRFVMLNARYSVDQAAGITEEIDCVIGMDDAISDDADAFNNRGLANESLEIEQAALADFRRYEELSNQ